MTDKKAPIQPSTHLFQSVLDALPLCVFWKDRNSVALGCNQALADVAGLKSPDEYIGKTDYEMPWSKEEADFFVECDQRVMDSEESELNIIESQVQANGKLAWLETSKIPLTDENGDVIGILGAFQDITERKRIEDENIENQKLDSLATLAAGLAHDFNNVMAMILGSTQLTKLKIAQGCHSSELVKYLDRIEQATERAANLTEKFMNYSQRGEVSKSIFSPIKMIEEAIAFILPTINSPINIEANNLEGEIYADLNQIHQVINNLLINAAHASTHGEKITVNIKDCMIEASSAIELRSGRYFAISIKDQGIGISPEQQQEIFKPYFTTKDNGHGLGLSSCLSIVKNHNGTLDVESTKGQGANFTVYLPISEYDTCSKLNHTSFTNEVVHGNSRILYIEDDKDTQESMLEIFNEIGYQVQSFSALKPALNFIEQQSDSFDMVVTDYIIGSDHHGGQDILDKVRATNNDCPVILVTGYFQRVENPEEEQNEFSYIAQKPVSLAQISQVLNLLSKVSSNNEKHNSFA